MLKWWSGSSTTTTVEDKNHDSDDNEVPSFPLPGSIQRAGGGGSRSSTATTASSDSTEDDDEEDNDEQDRKAIANLDLFISPPSPVSSKVSSKHNIYNATTNKTASSSIPSFEVTEEGDKSEFKAPSLPSFTLSTPSIVPALKAKPKPSHRPFPPEPSTTITPQTLNNGRVTFNSNTNKSGGSLLGSSLNPPPSTTVKPRKQRFVALEPGYSPLDWARLNKEGDDYELRYGFDTPQKFTLQEVSEHSTKNDAWSIFNSKVYNITPYLHFHPGGVGELMKCAGKDGTELFMKTHAWVNVELMMEGCLIGFLVRE